MLKYKLPFNKVGNISIKLNTDIDFINEVNNSIDESINKDIVDLETKKYTLVKNVNLNFSFILNNVYSTDFTNAGFTEEEITLSNKNYRFSYILMQIFDSKDVVNQNLIHNSYIPIYLFPDKFKSRFILTPNIKYYEFNNIYIGNNIDLNNDILYVNFKFYNAKTGKLIIMSNQANTSNKEDIFYFDLKINKTNLTYEFVDNVINAKEYVDNTFLNKLNDINKTENKIPKYPDGNLFSVNGVYLNQT